MTNESKPVPVNDVAMKLLDVRLQSATAIVTSVAGSFTAEEHSELCLLKAGGGIEIHRIVEDGKLSMVFKTETRSVLRSLAVVRYPGEQRDVVTVSADGGALSVLDFQDCKLKILHCVTFGKTGCRRSTPGQYVASDPKGRAVMVSAVEKRKLVYVLNRDANGQPTIASPLEAHRNRNITFATVGVDNGYDNPIFATLELQYKDDEDPEAMAPTPTKQLAYYELDLGLNHVSRRWATSTHPQACCLAALPGGADGPGGVLVGGEDWIQYLHEGQTAFAAPVPRRALHPKTKGILVTHIVVHRQKKNKFFALAQTELGDVFKVTVLVDSDDKSKVTGLQVALLDTLPTANALNISKLGMVFCASEFGEHALYQFERIDLPDAPTTNNAEGDLTTERAVELAPTFTPTTLKNVRKVDRMDNPSPTTGVMVGELAGNEVSPQIYRLTGRGPTSALSVTRHGASVTELAVSDLPGVPGAIFTIPDHESGNDRFIVVSFADATLALSVGESVEEVGKESGFLTNSPTLACSALGTDGAICQVHPAGVRHIQKGQVKQWHCPGLKRIECASANESQVVIALAGGEVIYFELDSMSGNLTESTTRDMGSDVCCLDVGTIQKGRSRSMFAAVGCRDQTVRIVSLEPGSLLQQRSSTALKSRPHSVSIQPVTSAEDNAVIELMLVIGLDDGSSLRATVDPVTGAIGANPTRRFLGARPVAVSRISLDSVSSSLLLSSRPWISRKDESSGKHIMAPLSYVPLDHGCSFSSDAVREGVVATAGKTLRILSIDSSSVEGGDDEAFNTKRIALRYTPRQMTLMSMAGTGDKRRVALAIVESDNNDYGQEEKKSMGFDATGEGKKASGGGDDAMDVESDEEGEKKEDAEDEADDGEKEARRTPIRGPVPPGPGHWGSCVRLVDPTSGCATVDCVELSRNEAALCCASVRFHSKGGEALLAVGTVTGLSLHPLKPTPGHIVLYRIVNGSRFQLLHKTPVEDGPVWSLAHFQGRLLAGVGNCLRLYEMGQRQLLRKAEYRGVRAKTLQTVGDRVYVGDLLQSVRVVSYDGTRLGVMGQDAQPRPMVCQEVLDWNTVAVGDKFGNVSVLRLGATTAPSSTGERTLWDREDVASMDLVSQYYVGEVVTGLCRASFGGAESLLYVTVSGRMGALVPLASRDDVEFYQELQTQMREHAPRVTGRDPWAYRSTYSPAMHVMDGDLCDSFNGLPDDLQRKVAEAMDRTIGEISKRLEDTRNQLL